MLDKLNDPVVNTENILERPEYENFLARKNLFFDLPFGLSGYDLSFIFKDIDNPCVNKIIYKDSINHSFFTQEPTEMKNFLNEYKAGLYDGFRTVKFEQEIIDSYKKQLSSKEDVPEIVKKRALFLQERGYPFSHSEKLFFRIMNSKIFNFQSLPKTQFELGEFVNKNYLEYFLNIGIKYIHQIGMISSQVSSYLRKQLELVGYTNIDRGMEDIGVIANKIEKEAMIYVENYLEIIPRLLSLLARNPELTFNEIGEEIGVIDMEEISNMIVELNYENENSNFINSIYFGKFKPDDINILQSIYQTLVTFNKTWSKIGVYLVENVKYED